MNPRFLHRAVFGLAAAGLIAYGATLPLWTMTMRAPQYPKGLHLSAYGTRMAGDVSEIDILNHYIGMPPLQAPELETALFPVGIGVLIALCLLSPFHRWLRALALVAVAAAPVAILADLQWQLYVFGHSMNPKAPIRLPAFTPLVVGGTKIGNFESFGLPSWGFWCLTGSVILLMAPGWLTKLHAKQPGRKRRASVATAAAAGLALIAAAHPEARPTPLQDRIDAAAPGGTIEVGPGVYAGPIVIKGPLSLIAPQGATIDGGGTGSVVTITGHGVTVRGFTLRRSGRAVTEEAAGITVTGDHHRIQGNRVEDVYFGIHVGDGAGVVVHDNTIVPGERYGARPGHGISAWHLRDSVLSGNRISHARDGIYLSFTERVAVTDNTITDCRYGLHSMYSQQARFEGNRATGNLLGAALMNSDRLVFRRNHVAGHREGAAAYGILLKDIGDLLAEDNRILSNRVGVYAEAVPTDPSNEAILRGNVIAGNEVGLALQSTAALTVTSNRIAENLTDVRPLGRTLSPGMRWIRDGVGNSWGRYRGYDANHDGIGDVPYQLDDAMDGLVRRNPAIQAFLYTPAHYALEAAARMFPLYRQPPVLIDTRPLMSARAGGSR
jgi:nitrous oxidase accessory protein